MHPNWGSQKFVSSHLIESEVCILFFSYLRWKQNNQSSCREHPIDLNFLFSHNIEIPGQHHCLAGPSRLASTTCDGTPRTPNNSVRCSIEKGARRSGKEPCRRQPRFQSDQKRSFFDMLITRLVHVLLCALMSFLPCMWCKKNIYWVGERCFLSTDLVVRLPFSTLFFQRLRNWSTESRNAKLITKKGGFLLLTWTRTETQTQTRPECGVCVSCPPHKGVIVFSNSLLCWHTRTWLGGARARWNSIDF